MVSTKTVALGVVFLAGVALFLTGRARRSEGELVVSAREMVVRDLVLAETFILDQTPRLKRLTKGILNLRWPDHQSAGMFADSVEVSDVAAPDGNGRWTIAGATSVGTAELDLWRPLLDSVAYFAHAKLTLIRARAAGPDQFAGDVGFAGLARTHAGGWRAVRAMQEVTWRRADDDWRITAWRMGSLETRDRERLMFREVLGDVVPSDSGLREARRSRHEEKLVELARTKTGTMAKPLYARYFEISSVSQHPGLSVVDVDGDGHDDLYVTMRWGRNLLFRNRGDGTFVEEARRWGLGIKHASTCAIFADFDNDGDPDLFLGRSLERGQYLVNENGRFVNRTATHVAGPLPYLIASIAAADFNGDGLLDVYISTYGLPLASWSREKYVRTFLPHDQAEKLIGIYQRTTPKDRFVNAPGPPNVLLVNRGGGRFEVAPESEQVAEWLNTLQATWSDYDGDGDPDLYVSNDFAPDHLYRNDGTEGFRDVTAEQGGNAMMGFGMGASWGDYDNDGRRDLYVSNMYSKAGRRITARFPDLDPRLTRSAEGNRLFRNTGSKFELVSGADPPAVEVARAGWSWGGQFADLDNDGYLDLYVPNGYYTAPDAIAREVDL